ncbi:hypothetical protein ACA910_011562 [Epithemia clementina (nom. ined.)]
MTSWLLWFIAVPTCVWAQDSNETEANTTTTPSIYELLNASATTENLIGISTAIEASGLGPILDDVNASFTLFAPDDSAVSALDADLLTQLFLPRFILHLQNLLLYHVVGGDKFTAADLAEDFAGRDLNMLNKERVEVELVDDDNNNATADSIQLNELATVIVPDLEASNGFMHVINAVLRPTFLDHDVVDMVKKEFQLVYELILAADLEQELLNTTEMTFFAWEMADFDLFRFLKLPVAKDLLVSVLRYNIGTQVIPLNSLSSGDEVTVSTLDGQTLTITDNANGILAINGQATVAPYTSSTLANNGIIHTTSDLVFPPTLFGIIASTDDLSTLFKLVMATRLVALNTDGPFTAFVPDDTAFAASIPEAVATRLLSPPWRAHLTSILLFHVASGSYDSSQVAALTSLQMLNSQNISIAAETSGNSTLLINGQARVTEADIEASNGVAHLIDAVLLPDFMSTTIVEVIESTFPELVALLDLVNGDLQESLGNSIGLTVFAPSATAIAEFMANNETNNDNSTLTRTLAYHVVAQVIPAESIEIGPVLRVSSLVDKAFLNVTRAAHGTVIVNDMAQVVESNVLANNGIIHVINAVLTPPEETDDPTSSAAMMIPSVVFAALGCAVAMLMALF